MSFKPELTEEFILQHKQLYRDSFKESFEQLIKWFPNTQHQVDGNFLHWYDILVTATYAEWRRREWSDQEFEQYFDELIWDVFWPIYEDE